MLRTPTLLSTLLLALPLHAQEGVAPIELQDLTRTHLEAARSEYGFPGACAAFVLPDGSIGAVAVGHVDAEGKEPLSVTHRMFSGSIGKTYVAAVALQLAGAGKLDLDAEVAEYLGENEWYPRLPNHDAITVRMLLNHTSGIPEHVWKREFGAAVRADPDRVWKPEELVAFILGDDPVFAAGKGWSYADTNYVVAGMVLEQVTGRTWFDLLKTRLLEPLALNETTPSDRRDLPRLANAFASGVAFHEGPTVVEQRYFVNPQFEWCGGGVCSTTRDLARWCRELFGGDVIPAALREQHLAGVPARRVGGHYALGVILRRTPLGPGRGHSGIMPGYLSEMTWYPDLRLAVAVQFNTDDGRKLGKSPAAYVDEIAAIVAGKRVPRPPTP